MEALSKQGRSDSLSACRERPKGREPHPVVWVVNAKSKHDALAAMILARSTPHDRKTKHAIGSGHTAILGGREHTGLCRSPVLARSDQASVPVGLPPRQSRLPSLRRPDLRGPAKRADGCLKVDAAIAFVEDGGPRGLEDRIEFIASNGGWKGAGVGFRPPSPLTVTSPMKNNSTPGQTSVLGPGDDVASSALRPRRASRSPHRLDRRGLDHAGHLLHDRKRRAKGGC